MVRESGNIIEGGAPLGADRPQAAERKLAAALRPRSGHVVVIAASAEDAERLLYRVETEMVSYRCAWLDGDHLESADLVRALESEAPDASSLPASMRALAAEARAIGRPVVMIVRRADAAAAARLERLRLMVDAGESSDWLRLVLLGGPTLLAALREPSGRALASRVTSLIIVEDTGGAAVPLGATSTLMHEPPDAAVTRRRAAAWRIAVVGVLGALVAAAAVPLLVRLRAPAGIAIESSPIAPPIAAPSSDREPSPAAEPAAAAESEPSAAVKPEVPASPDVTPSPRAIVHEPASPKAGGRSVQVGAFRDPARAGALRDELAKRFEWVMVTQLERDGVVWHRVRVEGLDSASAVRDAIASLRRAGYQPIVVR